MKTKYDINVETMKERGGIFNVDKLVELIVMLDEYNATGAIGYSTYQTLMSKAREILVANMGNAA